MRLWWGGMLRPYILVFLLGESELERTFRLADIEMLAIQSYAKQRDVVIPSLLVFIWRSDIENVTEIICANITRKQNEKP
jgi:hypothetical protein